MRPFRLAATVLLASQAAFAQTPTRVTAAAFARDPGRYLNRPVSVEKMGCLSDFKGGYICTSYRGLYVTSSQLSPPNVAKDVNESCGGKTEFEDEPDCMFDIVFTPVGLVKDVGLVTHGDKSVTGPIWKATATTIVATPRY